MSEPSAASAAARASSVPEEEDVEEQGHSYSRRTLICRGSNYALPQTALPHRKLPSAPVAEPIELDGFELPWAVRLLHEVYGSVMSARSGHIDWVAVARRMEAQRKPLVAAAAALSRSNKAAAASAAAAAAAAAEQRANLMLLAEKTAAVERERHIADAERQRYGAYNPRLASTILLDRDLAVV